MPCKPALTPDAPTQLWFARLVITLSLTACSQTQSDATATDASLSRPQEPASTRDAATEGPQAGSTYYGGVGGVSSILQRSCVGCHTEGGIAPFPLTTYSQAKARGPLLLAAVESGHMPPWGARSTAECMPRLRWKDDLRLSLDDKATLAAWVAADMPEGDANTAAPLPPIATTSLQGANVKVAIPRPISVSGHDDQYVCFSLDPGVKEDVWLTGSHIIAGNAAIVHHVLLYADPEGQSAQLAAANGHYPCFGGPGISGRSELLGAWAPGAVPAITPPEVGIPFKAGSRIIMNVHYHPTGNGNEEDAGSTVQLRWTTRRPAYEGRLSLIGNFAAANMPAAGGIGFGLQPGPDDAGGTPQFRIPAGSPAHTETMRFLVPGQAQARTELRLWAVGAHMHYLGRDMKIELVHNDQPQPSKECLLQVPDWDFDWQRAYTYDATLDQVPTLRPGDELVLRCTYDNTLKNPALARSLGANQRNQPIDVRLGEGTLDEMCLGIFGIAVRASAN